MPSNDKEGKDVPLPKLLSIHQRKEWIFFFLPQKMFLAICLGFQAK
jgi:hypothetical protein